MAARVGILKPKRHQNATTTQKTFRWMFVFVCTSRVGEWVGERERERLETRKLWRAGKKNLSACVDWQINFDFSLALSRRNISNKTFQLARAKVFLEWEKWKWVFASSSDDYFVVFSHLKGDNRAKAVVSKDATLENDNIAEARSRASAELPRRIKMNVAPSSTTSVSHLTSRTTLHGVSAIKFQPRFHV